MECPRCRRRVDEKSRRCNWCGVDVPVGQHLLEESGVVVPIKPAESKDDHSPATRLATLGDRFIAIVLDAAVLLLACALIDVWAFMSWGVISASELRVTAASILVGGSLDVVVIFLYVWLLEAGFGSTLGKAIVGIGVINNSDRSSLAASAIRNLLRILDGLGFYLVGALVASCSKFRRRIGDICAGTYVVEGNLSDLTRCLAVFGWLALLSGGAWALPRVCAHPKPLKAPRHFGRVVVELGRADNSIYVKMPSQGIDVSLVTGLAGGNAHPALDQAASKPLKTDDQESRVVP